MGADKAFLNLGGSTLLERAIALARDVCGEVGIVGDVAKFEGYGNVIADLYPDCGPLAGIHAALLHSSFELNLMLAVDMPFVTRELLEFLFAVASETDASVVVPRSAREFQPLCAVYRRDFASAAEEALRAGKYKIDPLFAGIALRVVEEQELSRVGFSEQVFFNANTPEDLRVAEKQR